MTRLGVIRITTFAVLLFLTNGCAAVPLSTLGSVLGFAGSAASAGSEVYNLGKLYFSAVATYDESTQAVVATAHEAGLTINSSNSIGKRDDEIVYHMQDACGQKLDVIVDRRAEHLVQFEID